MHRHHFHEILTASAGVLLILLTIVDVFMTVLYARAGTGVLSHRLATCGWAIVRRIARSVPREKDRLLSYYGPACVVCLAAMWIGLLLLGFTLLMWVSLGTGITSKSGATPTDFFTALEFAGGTLTTAGSADLSPVSAYVKVLTVVDSLLGVSVLTLSLTYIIQIYTALQRRNALVLGLHHASGGTGDAAVLLAGLGPRDDFTHAESLIAGIAAESSMVYESHHFYSVLIYFRFRERHYALGRSTLLILEMLALIDAALDDDRHGWVKRSAAVIQLREALMHTLAEFSGVYLPGGAPRTDAANPGESERWTRRYHAATDHLRKAGISLTSDLKRGAKRYIELRQKWDPLVMAFAHYMEHSTEEIDPTGVHPSATGRHREMPTPELQAKT